MTTTPKVSALLRAALTVLALTTMPPLGAAPGDWRGFNGLASGCNGPVRAIAPGPDGLIAIGGAFSLCGDIAVDSVALFDPAADRFIALGDPGDDAAGRFTEVLALAWFQGVLHAGGQFSRAGDVPPSDLARWDGAAWQEIRSGAEPSRVTALVADDERLFVGADAIVIGEGNLQRIARWDGSAWSALGTGVAGQVHALALATDGSLYVGGRLTRAGSLSVRGVARWHEGTWHSLGVGATAGVNSTVLAIAADRDGAYIAGPFTEAGGLPACRVARWQNDAWTTLGSDGLNDTALALSAIDEGLVVAGNFTTAGSIAAAGLALWDGTQWQALAADAKGIEAMAQGDGRLYAGGSLRTIDGVPYGHFAVRDRGIWSRLGTREAQGVDEVVQRIVVDDKTVHLLGAFRLADGQPSGEMVSVQDGSFNPTTTDPARVLDITRYLGERIVVGKFSQIGATAANNVAVWRDGRWLPLGDGIGGTNDFVWRAMVWRGELFVAGRFGNAGGEPATNLARWDGQRWRGMHVGNAGTMDAVYALVADHEHLYAGGSFSRAEDIEAAAIARWDGTRWATLGSGLDGTVKDLLLSNDGLIAAGAIVKAGGAATPGVARWQHGQWHTFAGPSAPRMADIAAMTMQDGMLYLGGSLHWSDNTATTYLARWQRGRWYPVTDRQGRGAPAPVTALATHGDLLRVGGGAGRYGGTLGSGYAEWTIDPVIVFASSFEARP